MPDWSMIESSELPIFAKHGLAWKTPVGNLYVDATLLFRYLYDTLLLAIESTVAGCYKNAKLHIRLWPLISKKVGPEKIFCQVSCVYSFALLSAL